MVAQRKLGVGVHTLDCTRCGRRFRYERLPGRQGHPRTRCFTCRPRTSKFYRELPVGDVDELLADMPAAKREYIAHLLPFLRTCHPVHRRVPKPPHDDDCSPCEALRLLAIERGEV